MVLIAVRRLRPGRSVLVGVAVDGLDFGDGDVVGGGGGDGVEGSVGAVGGGPGQVVAHRGGQGCGSAEVGGGAGELDCAVGRPFGCALCPGGAPAGA